MSTHAKKSSKVPGEGSASIISIAAIVFAVMLVLRIFAFDAVIVRGESMLPGLREGDIVLVLKLAYGLRFPSGEYFVQWRKPKGREIVIARRPDTGTVVVKRVREGFSAGTNTFFLLGDNIYDSSDSREFGPVPMKNILGMALPLPRFPKLWLPRNER